MPFVLTNRVPRKLMMPLEFRFFGLPQALRSSIAPIDGARGTLMEPVTLKPCELDFETDTVLTLIGGLPGCAWISTSFCEKGCAWATSVTDADGTNTAAAKRPTRIRVIAVTERRNRPGLSSVAVLVSNLLGAPTPTCVVAAAGLRCHHLRSGGGTSASDGMPWPSGPTAPNPGNPVSEAIFWTAGSAHTTATRLPSRAEWLRRRWDLNRLAP